MPCNFFAGHYFLCCYHLQNTVIYRVGTSYTLRFSQVCEKLISFAVPPFPKMQYCILGALINSLFCKGDPKKQKCFLGIRNRSGAKKHSVIFYGMRKAELAMTRLARVSRTLTAC